MQSVSPRDSNRSNMFGQPIIHSAKSLCLYNTLQTSIRRVTVSTTTTNFTKFPPSQITLSSFPKKSELFNPQGDGGDRSKERRLEASTLRDSKHAMGHKDHTGHEGYGAVCDCTVT